jgi:hypothetical protein
MDEGLVREGRMTAFIPGKSQSLCIEFFSQLFDVKLRDNGLRGRVNWRKETMKRLTSSHGALQ